MHLPVFVLPHSSEDHGLVYTCRIMVAGPSVSGKTRITKQILESADSMFREPVKTKIICYDTWQPMFDELQGKMDISFHKGLPNEEQFEDWSSTEGHTILVIDDCMSQRVNSSDLEKMFA